MVILKCIFCVIILRHYHDLKEIDIMYMVSANNHLYSNVQLKFAS